MYETTENRKKIKKITKKIKKFGCLVICAPLVPVWGCNPLI